MTKKVWKVSLKDGDHTVELDHSYISGTKIIKVDGKELADVGEVKKIIDWGGDYPFSLRQHHCFVRIRTNGVTFKYDLIVDGYSVTTGKTVPLQKNRSASKKNQVSFRRGERAIHGPISNQAEAREVLRDASGIFGILALLQLLAGLAILFLSRDLNQDVNGLSLAGWAILLLFNFLFTGIFSLLLRWLQSRIVTVLLCFFMFLNFLGSFLGGVGGVLVNALLFWVSIRAMRAAFCFQRCKADGVGFSFET